MELGYRYEAGHLYEGLMIKTEDDDKSNDLY